MYRVPSQRRQIAFRRLKIGLAALLALAALVYQGMAVWFSMREIIGPHVMEFHDLLDLSIASIGIVCSLTFVYSVVRNWPRRAIAASICIILFSLAYFAWDIYAVHIVY
jgi:hypothetical protein